MNTYLFASVENMWLLAGWTMIHFLWLGTLFALAALVSRWLLRRASANVRYAVALTCLAMLAAMPIAIATWLGKYSPSVQATELSSRNEAAGQVVELKNAEPTALATPPGIAKSDVPTTVQPAQQAGPPSAPTLAVPSTTDPLSLTLVAINKSVQYLPWLWLIGTPITFAVTATGLIGTRRLRLSSRAVTDGPIFETLKKLANSLRLSRHVAVATCDRIVAPVLIGILRPIILLPPAALTGYSPDEIEMVLLHELAHVCRWDNLVNLLQRIIESLLFFHPAVWLISSWARREREACCDALVVARTDHPHAYAELLVALAAQMPRSVLFHPAASSAMAAGPLRSRIRRILKLEDDPMLISGKSFVLLLAAIVATVALAVLYLPSIGQAEQPKATAKENADADTPDKKNVVNPPGGLESRDKLQKEMQELQSEIKRKYEAYIDFAKGNELISVGPRDPETDLLIRDIADTQKKVADLTSGYYQLQTDYLIAKSELSDPKLLEIQAEEALKRDSQYADLLEKANTQAAASDGSEYQAVEKYRADFKKKAVREMQNKPNIPLQQLTQRFKTNSDSMQKQIALSTQNLEQKRKELEQRVGKSVDLERRGAELEKLQQIANDINAAMKQPNIEAEPLIFELKADSSGQTEILLNGNGTTEDAIRKLLRERVASNADQIVSLKADKSINYAEVMRIVDLLESLGIKKLALDTRSVKPTDATVTAEAGTAPNQSAASRAVESQVIATLPAQWQNPATKGYQELIKGVAAAQEKHLRPDRVQRDGKFLLVATPQPTEKDWPAMLGEPPRKERVIAEKAWQQLGLKLAPLNSAEGMYRAYTNGQAGGILIVGGNVPKGLPVPSVLVKLDADAGSVETMDSLLGWLSKDEGRPLPGIKCYAMADDKEYLFESQPPTNTTPPNTIQSAPDLTQSTPARHSFPSLENQKLADLAWKSLQLEIEPIGPDELKRVKSLGYDGGVMVANIADHSAGPASFNMLQSGDILVGLHVWPVTSLKDVATVLKREDLADLNPLKFYAVRVDANENNLEISGRIAVKESRPATQAADSWMPAQPPTSNSNNKPTLSPAPTLFSAPEYEVVPHSQQPVRDRNEPSRESLPYIPKVTLENGPSAAALPASPNSPPLPAIAPAMPSSDWLPSPTAPSAAAELRPEFLKRRFAESRSSDEHSILIAEAPSPTPPTTSPALKSPFVAPKDGAAPTPTNSSASKPIGSNIKPNTQQAKSEDHIVPPSIAVAKTDAHPTATPLQPTATAPTPARDANTFRTSADDQILASYDVPKELVGDVKYRLGQNQDAKVRTSWDDRGRLLMQGPRARHDEFKSLLKDTPKWRDPAAVKERGAAPISIRKINDEEALEWRTAGLTFMRDTRPWRHTPSTPDSVLVSAVAPGSAGAWAGVQPGDALDEVGTFKITHLSDLESVLKTLGEGFQKPRKVIATFYHLAPNGSGYRVVGGFQIGGNDAAADSSDKKTNPAIETASQDLFVDSNYEATKASGQLGATSDRLAISSKPDRSSLRYDGKTFDEWCRIWSMDSNDKVRALEALESFAAAGLEREANWMILGGVYSNSTDIAPLTRKYLSTLSKSQATPIVNELLKVLKSDLSPKRRVQALRAIAAIGPNSEPALEELKNVLASKVPQERIAAATAIKRIVGKDQYQKPVADVLGEELGITVEKSADGKWLALPRDDKVDVSIFGKFNDDVIKEQELLLPPDEKKPSK